MKHTFWGEAQVVKWGMKSGATLELPGQGTLTLERLVLSRQYEASRVHITQLKRVIAVISSRVVGLEKVCGCFSWGVQGGQDPGHSMQGALSFSGLYAEEGYKGRMRWGQSPSRLEMAGWLRKGVVVQVCLRRLTGNFIQWEGDG